MLPFAQLLTVRIGGVRIAGAAFEGARAAQAPVSLSLNLSFQGDIRMARKTKEESQRTRDRILDAAEHVFMSKGWPTPPWATSPTTPACPGCRLRPLQEQDRCLRRHERPRAGRGRGADRVRADGKALESLYASMLQYVRIYSEEGSMQRVLEILYDKCEQSDENAPLLRRRDIWERHALRNSENCCAPRCATKTCPARWTCACPTSTCTP